MARQFDADRELQSDIERVKRLNKKGISDLSLGGVIEHALWAGAILSVLAMLGAMPWVGSDKAIPGEVWLIFSLTGILFFAGMAGLVRLVGGIGEDVDTATAHRTARSRGR